MQRIVRRCAEVGTFLTSHFCEQRETKGGKVLIRDMLFADDVALTAHSEKALQRLMSSYAHACSVSLKKTNILGQDVSNAPSVQIHDYTLEVVEEFVYLGSTISSNLFLDIELDKRIGKAVKAMADQETETGAVG